MTNIALSKGRIEKEFIKILENKKIIKNLVYDRELVLTINNIRIILVKSNDVFSLINNGYADIGIVGSDVIEERNDNNITTLLDLNTGKCSFVLATKPEIDINKIKSIATKYPNKAKEFLNRIKLECEIIKMNGSLESAPLIGYSDGIIDLVDTGNTLKANGLVEKIRFENISTKVVTSIKNKENIKVKRLIKELK